MIQHQQEAEQTTFDLAGYLNRAASFLVRRVLHSAGLRYSLAFQRAANLRRKLEERGEHVPAFLIASITTRCNLFCAGCYARAHEARFESPRETLSTERWSQLFLEARDCGISFILLAGGEPFLRRDVLEAAGRVKGVLFPTFTNGTLLDDAALDLLARHRNLLPVLSLEGGRRETDGRRANGTFDTLMKAMEALNRRALFFGLSLTVTTENLSLLVSMEFQAELIEKGCRAVVFVEYVPVSSGTQSLAPTEQERGILEQEQSRLRTRYPDVLFLSFPGDEKESGGCLAAGRGFFHISATGSAEPCPFSPYSDTSLRELPLRQALNSPLFRYLNSGMLASEHTGGCVLVDKEDQVKAFFNR